MGIHFCSFYFKSNGHNQGGVALNRHVLSSPGGSGTGEGRDHLWGPHVTPKSSNPGTSWAFPPSYRLLGRYPGGLQHASPHGTLVPTQTTLGPVTMVGSGCTSSRVSTAVSWTHHRNQPAQTPAGTSWPLLRRGLWALALTLTEKRYLGFSLTWPVLSAVTFLLVLLRNNWHSSLYRLKAYRTMVNLQMLWNDSHKRFS